MLEKNKVFAWKDEEPEKKSDKQLMKDFREAEKLFPYKDNKFAEFKDDEEKKMLRKLVIEARESEETINRLLKRRFGKRYHQKDIKLKKK